MRLIVAAVGTRMPAWVKDGWQEYARRFPRALKLELIEIPLAKRSRAAPIERVRAAEGEALLAAVPAGFRLVVLDQRGRQWTTPELAAQLEGWMQDENGVAFLIGGPDGLPEACRERAHRIWALSRLTLPHPLVRAIVAEQLYRAWTITQNHPYHRE
jgi:23S rRNA (pseudouridine1915-N3)-methyltransferase